MENDIADIVIVGSGPAGAAAALEARLMGLVPLLVSEGPVGGLVNAARRIDSVPGHPGGLSGTAWASNCRRALESAGIQALPGRVEYIAGSDNGFAIFSSAGLFAARTVVLATGTRPLAMSPAPPPSPWLHRDVTTLPAELRAATVAVVGSGEAAIDTALNLADRNAAVTLFARGARLHGSPGLIAELACSMVSVRLNAGAFDVRNPSHPVHLSFDDAGEWRGDHAVFCIGRESRIDEIDMTAADGAGGLFLAGEMIRETGRFIAPALADGRRAAQMAFRHIHHKEMQ